MAQREAYQRCVLRRGKLEIIAGVQIHDSEGQVDRRNLLNGLNLVMEIAASYLLPEDDEMDIAGLVEYRIKQRWPGRAYFIEVCNSEGENDWVQLFQPYGVPIEEPLRGTVFSPYR